MTTPGTASRVLPKPGLGGVAGKSYNVAAAWEQTAALEEIQLRAVEGLGQCCSQRPYPAHVVDDAASGALPALDSHGRSAKEGAYVGTLEDAVLHNANQFHKWHAELEAACASEMEEKYKRYADLLNSHLQACDGILAKVDSTLELFDMLTQQHRDVAARSKSLHSSCEQLVREKDALQEFADALRAKLKFFDEFETVYAEFHKAQLALDNDQFMSLLRKLDDCKAYVVQNTQYADSGVYATKFRQLQARALGAVRSKVQAALRNAVAAVQAGVHESGGTGSTGVLATAASAGAAAAGAGSAPGASPLRHGSVGPPLPRMASSNMAGLAEGAEVPLLYVRFRAVAEPQLKGLFKEIESRCQRVEYQRLLEECQVLYAQARLQLVQPFVQQRLQEQSAQALPLFTRIGCEHLMRVCQLEAQLFEQFFASAAKPRPPPQQPITSASLGYTQQQSGGAQQQHGAAGGGGGGGPGPAEAMQQLMEPLCTCLYDALRPLVITLQDVDELCEMVDILKHEVLGDQLSKRGASAEALRPMLLRTLADVQGRLIYRCQAFIKEEVGAFQPSQDDLDYPGKLERAVAAAAAEQRRRREEGEDDGTDGAANGAAVADGNGAQLAPANGAASAAAALHDPALTLYPPLRTTLLVLSKLYHAVDPRTFGGLAQEAVSACTLTVQQASRRVTQRSGPLDAQLFMIKHLLFLREQIAPFDVDFATTDFDLDFTHMRDHLRRTMAGEGLGALFTLSSRNAVVKMLGQGGPRVLTYQVDSKRELEKQLKAACESFIMALTKVAVEPMLSFITKVTAVRVAAQAQAQHAAAQAAAQGQAAPALGAVGKPLREQAFASPAKLAEMVVRVNDALQTQLPAAVQRMQLYLTNPSTHAILFKPVKSNIAEAHSQVAALVAAEYQTEEVAEVPLKQPQELSALLDSLLVVAS